MVGFHCVVLYLRDYLNQKQVRYHDYARGENEDEHESEAVLYFHWQYELMQFEMSRLEGYLCWGLESVNEVDVGENEGEQTLVTFGANS